MPATIRRLSLCSCLGCCVILCAAASAYGDGSVYVTNNNAVGPGTVAQFDAGPGGELTPKSPDRVPVGSGPYGLAVDPAARSVYVTNYWDRTVSQLDVGAGGTLAPKVPPTVSVGTNPVDVAASPDGRSLYLVGASGGSQFVHFDVGADGTLSPRFSTSPGDPGPRSGLGVAPDGRNVYITGWFSGGSGVVGWYVVTTDGSLAGGGGRFTGDRPADVVASADRGSVYQVNAGSNTVAQYDRAADGGLTPKSPPSLATGKWPTGMVMSLDGTSLYVADRDSNVLSHFRVGAGGRLSPLGFIATGDGPTDVAVSSDGLSVYATNSRDDTVSQFDVGPGGALTEKVPRAVPAGPVPTRLATSPDLGPPPPGSGSGGGPGPGADPGGGSDPGAGSGPGLAPKAPALTSLSVTNPLFAATRTAPGKKSAAGPRRGTTFRYRLSRASTVRIVIERALPGKRFVRAATLTRAGKAGAGSLAFSGWVGAKVLPPARYRATATATADKLRSAPRVVSFRIVTP
jgi:DNA-binding beta-propeller fold protein YncE